MAKPRIIFFGNERLISGLAHTDAPILTMLIDEGYDVVAVVANDAGTKSRKPKPLEVAELARANDIPVHTPERPMDIHDQLKEYQADAAVLVAYGRIVPQKLIDLFPYGIINVHPSLLPKYRGPSPIESAIANGDESTGVSIMSLTKEMDAGPVYYQTEVALNGTETAPSLAATLSDIAADRLKTILPSVLGGSLQAESQAHDSAVYCQLIPKQDARLDPVTQTAEHAERLVRAYLAYPRARLEIAGSERIIVSAHVSGDQKTPLDIAFKKDVLSIDELVAPSGKAVSADAFIRGYLK